MNALKSYQDQGLIPGVFRWIEESGRSPENVEEVEFHRDMKEIEPAEAGWRRFEPLPDAKVTLVFANGETMSKTFTSAQFCGE